MTRPLPDDASLHVHFPETQLDLSRSIDALLDRLKGREEYHVNEGRASDTDTKTCSFCQSVLWRVHVVSDYLCMNQAGKI